MQTFTVCKFYYLKERDDLSERERICFLKENTGGLCLLVLRFAAPSALLIKKYNKFNHHKTVTVFILLHK